jgi:hypothetical protein
MNYFNNCYEILCKMLRSLYTIDEKALEQENEHYCRMTDGDFTCKLVTYSPQANTHDTNRFSNFIKSSYSSPMKK